jgi:hypothetical protein
MKNSSFCDVNFFLEISHIECKIFVFYAGLKYVTSSKDTTLQGQNNETVCWPRKCPPDLYSLFFFFFFYRLVCILLQRSVCSSEVNVTLWIFCSPIPPIWIKNNYLFPERRSLNIRYNIKHLNTKMRLKYEKNISSWNITECTLHTEHILKSLSNNVVHDHNLPQEVEKLFVRKTLGGK